MPCGPARSTFHFPRSSCSGSQETFPCGMDINLSSYKHRLYKTSTTQELSLNKSCLTSNCESKYPWAPWICTPSNPAATANASGPKQIIGLVLSHCFRCFFSFFLGCSRPPRVPTHPKKRECSQWGWKNMGVMHTQWRYNKCVYI